MNQNSILNYSAGSISGTVLLSIQTQTFKSYQVINFMYCKFVILLKLNKMCIFKGFNVNFLIWVIILWLYNLTKIKLKLHIYYNALK